MGANVYMIDSDRGSSLKEENSVTLDFRRGSSQRAGGAAMRDLIDEDTSRDVEVRRQAPSVIARLMGLDTVPPLSVVSHKQQNEKSKESSVRHRGSADRSIQTITSEEFKDVYEVMESSKFTKREERPVWKGSPDGNVDLRRQELMNAKRLSTEERLQNYINMSGALEDIGSDTDVFMKFLHEPNTNHLHDLKCFPPSPEPNNITILRPTNNIKYGASSDVFRGSERKAESYINCPKDVSLSRKPMTNFATHSLKKQESHSHKSPKLLYTGKTGWKDGCFTNLPRSRHSDSGSDNCDMLKDVLNFGPIDSLHGYSIRRRAPRRRSKCGRDKLHSFHTGGEENKLPVQDVHVNMEETGNIDTVNNLSENRKPVLSELFDIKANVGYLVENSMHSECMDVEPACISIEEQVQQHAVSILNLQPVIRLTNL